ncbi:MAG: M23 family metallopeptidase [Microscillaceae bacterium]|nr:M23 family metallopeptidase [Microscillaceae bacterium]
MRPKGGPPQARPKAAARPDTGNPEKSIDFLAKADQRLREEMEQFQGGGSASEMGRTDQLPWLLRSPLRGLVSEKFDARTEHYGVDIVAEKDAPIQAIAEGTVLMSTWTEDTGYVLTLQHPGGMVSVYKHCSRLLKKSGDFVKSGEAIAIIGNTGKFTSGPHLHLELWLRGYPQNPEDYIAF